MKGCKGVCSRVESKRPFGDPYKTHSHCNRCDSWINKNLLIDNKCPCCMFPPKMKGRKQRVIEAYQFLSA
jgi:hypothetical protein